jgi:hypothetical protein
MEEVKRILENTDIKEFEWWDSESILKENMDNNKSNYEKIFQ